MPIIQFIGRNLILTFHYDMPFIAHIDRFLANFHKNIRRNYSILIFPAHPVKGMYNPENHYVYPYENLKNHLYFNCESDYAAANPASQPHSSGHTS